MPYLRPVRKKVKVPEKVDKLVALVGSRDAMYQTVCYQIDDTVHCVKKKESFNKMMV